MEHPLRDAWWDDRNILPLLDQAEVPVYLGIDISDTMVADAAEFDDDSAREGRLHLLCSIERFDSVRER